MLQKLIRLFKRKKRKPIDSHKYFERLYSYIKPAEIGDKAFGLSDGTTVFRGGIGNEILRTVVVENGIIADMF